MNKELLIQKSIEALELSYSPYSHFRVGAAILLKDGNIIQGANIENASYGLTMCAERNTVFRTILSGYKTEDMVALALCADADEVPYPCGACRQVLSELFPLDAPIYVHNTRGKILETTVKELLPYIFNKENMD
ncbi:MAG: cytidine deaminase [Erysipelotrichaceae bacterium]|nr:cytidine deaminase [Erysipelotrichaceae bacterium]